VTRIAKRIRVTGRVQGVFYRAWTRSEARKLGVTGWVRNRSDGSVEAQVEGDEQAVGHLIDLMREGPPGSAVHGLKCEETGDLGLNAFEIRN
jgi:acylphosphatase